MPFELPTLPYSYDALEPYFDARTMENHHINHHGLVTNNLNSLLVGTEWEWKSPEEILHHLGEIPEDKRAEVRHWGGGYWNHNLFWQILSPIPTEMSQDLKTAIDSSFGSIDAMKEEFKRVSLKRYASGWVWFWVDGDKLRITSSFNHENPLMDGVLGKKILISFDVWEHAYYLQYQHRRGDFVDAFWNVVNWAEVSQRFAHSK